MAFNPYLLAGWVNRHTTENEIMLLKDKAGRSINRRRRREGTRFWIMRLVGSRGQERGNEILNLGVERGYRKQLSLAGPCYASNIPGKPQTAQRYPRLRAQCQLLTLRVGGKINKHLAYRAVSTPREVLWDKGTFEDNLSLKMAKPLGQQRRSSTTIPSSGQKGFVTKLAPVSLTASGVLSCISNSDGSITTRRNFITKRAQSPDYTLPPCHII